MKYYNVVERVEVSVLEPLTFEEAKALVVMLGGAENYREPVLSPDIGLAYTTPLARLVASLPPRQRQAFMRTMNSLWPHPQRRPRYTMGKKVRWKEHEIHDWNDAWAASFAAASEERETAMAEALIKAKGLHSV